MISTLAAVALLALTRAEIIERFKAPVVNQADGLVRVYADCPEDMWREFQTPVARFAANTVETLYRGLAKRPLRFKRPGIVIHLGDVRTNLTEVTAKVSTNDAQQAVTRIRVRAPGYADLTRLRMEIVKGFYRSVEQKELTDEEAVDAYRHADPALRVADERAKLEDWLAGTGTTNVEEGLRLMRKVFEPGRASRRDVLLFASRLYLYPLYQDLRFLGKYDCLGFHEALKLARGDASVRLAAFAKANDLPIFAGGKGAELAGAAAAYQVFLLEFARNEKDVDELADLLETADLKLNMAFEKAVKP